MNSSMYNYLEYPNLPRGKITAAVIGEDYDRYAKKLEKNGIKLYYANKNQKIDASASCHADMAVFYSGYGNIIVEKQQKQLAQALQCDGYKVTFTQSSAAGCYPSDVRLNAFILQDKLFCKSDAVDSTVKSRYSHIVSVKQGYAKCSAFIVTKDAAITDDPGIFHAIQSVGANGLLIEKGDIYLDGSHYGFIGGSGFLYDRYTAVFFGDIRKHRSYRELRSFLLNYGISCEITDDGKLTDIGGIVPLAQEQ